MKSFVQIGVKKMFAFEVLTIYLTYLINISDILKCGSSSNTCKEFFVQIIIVILQTVHFCPYPGTLMFYFHRRNAVCIPLGHRLSFNYIIYLGIFRILCAKHSYLFATLSFNLSKNKHTHQILIYHHHIFTQTSMHTFFPGTLILHHILSITEP